MPFRCSECGFSNFFGPVAAVGGLITNDENELLLVRRARDPGKGKWGLPGGFVDREESIEEALAREVREEIGLEVQQTMYLPSFPNLYQYSGVVSPVIDLFYLGRVGDPSQIRLAPDELDHHIWVRPSDTHLDQMAFPSNRLAIEYWLRSL
ncbi:MAG: NUDIX hydrolase [Rubripirellula sp.]